MGSQDQRIRPLTISIARTMPRSLRDVVDAVQHSPIIASERRVEHVIADPEPRIRFVEMGDSALIFRVMVWIDEPVSRGQVLDGLNTAIYKALNAAEISIPFPQRDVHLYNAVPPAS